jgi:nucleoside phosphorylase
MHHGDYTVGWICALATEMAAAVGMLDSHHPPLPQHSHDQNTYALGNIGEHNVVITCLPVTGTNSAAIVATRMQSSFTSVRFGLMVGIGGGVPSPTDDIRLGDVVVSKPEGTYGGVIQYDFGKTIQEGRFIYTGSLNRPPDILLAAVASLQRRYQMEQPELPKYLSQSILKYPKLEKDFTYQGAENDVLFEPEYNHPKENAECTGCDKKRWTIRPSRDETDPKIHYGLIASGNQVMRDGSTRERLRKELHILCFEMEAAGLMDNFPCLVIRGICDYADSHKNKRWQPYAAATAAAYAKELLYAIPRSRIIETGTINQDVKGKEPGPEKVVTPEHALADSQATKLLLENGFNINQGSSETDALLWAAKNGHVEAVRMLLDKGVNANTRDQRRGGMTPLHLAALQGHETVVRLLLEKGADPTVRTSKGATAEQVARSLGKTTVADLLQIATKSQYS